MINGVSNYIKPTARIASSEDQNNGLMDACQQFEALLVSQMLKEMRNTVPEGGVIPYSSGEKIFQEMLDAEYSNQMSKSNPVGLASMLYRQLQPKGLAPASDATSAGGNSRTEIF